MDGHWSFWQPRLKADSQPGDFIHEFFIPNDTVGKVDHDAHLLRRRREKELSHSCIIIHLTVLGLCKEPASLHDVALRICIFNLHLPSSTQSHSSAY